MMYEEVVRLAVSEDAIWLATHLPAAAQLLLRPMELTSELAQWVKRQFLPLKYDAADHPAEKYYAELYLDWIGADLNASARPLRILDAGCGTGRLLVPLAKRGHRLTGIDRHKHSIRIVRKKATANGNGIRIFDGSLERVLAGLPDAAFDAVMSIEVLLTSRDREGVTRELLRVLRPGGRLYTTHRTRFSLVVHCLRNGHLDDAHLVTTRGAGRLRKGKHRVFYNWQSIQEIRELYPRLGADLVATYPIGPFSGFSVDPLARICDPGTLSPAQQAQLRSIESRQDEDALSSSRFILAVSRKRESAEPGEHSVASSAGATSLPLGGN